ncbi:MAG: carbon-nitrogen hydrolase family protein [Hyphomicrobiales bacterium]
MKPGGEVFTAALVQMCAGRHIEKNIAQASDLIGDAVRGGAEFVSTPETTHLMETSSRRLFEVTVPQEDDLGVAAFGALAADLKIWLNIGSLAIRVAPDKVANRSFLFAPDGSLRAQYDKIHMFDVDLPNGERYRESKNYRPGSKAVLTGLPWAPLGLTVCYDLRFPDLYRQLAKAGAKFITVPSAFTRPTGEAHWHVLLRSRAIETGCFIFAAAQAGHHENGRETFGHSLIISPWGDILFEGEKKPCILSAEIDINLVTQSRARIPSLSHDRSFDLTGDAVLGTLEAVQ